MENRGEIPPPGPEAASDGRDCGGCRNSGAGIFGTGFQSHINGHQCNGAVLQNIAWDAHISCLFGLVKSRIAVAQVKEPLEVPYVLSYINHLEVWIARHLLLHVLAVRTGLHYEHLYHG